MKMEFLTRVKIFRYSYARLRLYTEAINFQLNFQLNRKFNPKSSRNLNWTLSKKFYAEILSNIAYYSTITIQRKIKFSCSISQQQNERFARTCDYKLSKEITFRPRSINNVHVRLSSFFT